ncbi:MAG: hypothetical protein WA642_18410, partial [Steroidobacteraceae bacterium]
GCLWRAGSRPAHEDQNRCKDARTHDRFPSDVSSSGILKQQQRAAKRCRLQRTEETWRIQ